jgi:hypothetical protein
MVSAIAVVSLWVAAIAGAVVLVELLVSVPLLLRLRSRIRQLAALLESEAAFTTAELERLRLARARMRVLVRPYRRAWKYVRHPLLVALLASYRQRRRARLSL